MKQKAPSSKKPNPVSPSNTEKDPAEWTTGNEPMTGAQASYLKTLSEEAKEPFDESLTKAEASKRIDELQAMTGRGKPASDSANERNAGTGGGNETKSDAEQVDAVQRETT